MRIPADPRPATWSPEPGCRSVFLPTGSLQVVGRRPDPGRLASGDTWAARLFVSLNVGSGAVHDLDTLVEVVRRVREMQLDGRASFFHQLGRLQHNRRSGAHVEEPGAQVIVCSDPDDPPEVFQRDMFVMAEIISGQMDQAPVVVEYQRNGMFQRMMGITSEPEHTPSGWHESEPVEPELRRQLEALAKRSNAHLVFVKRGKARAVRCTLGQTGEQKIVGHGKSHEQALREARIRLGAVLGFQPAAVSPARAGRLVNP